MRLAGGTACGLVAMASLCACGPPCAREGICTEPVPSADPDAGPLHQVLFTTVAVACRPFAGYEVMETPQGESVTGVDVCAEFEDACSCEQSSRTLEGLAVFSAQDGFGVGCLAWRLVEASFWAYATGLVCPDGAGWDLTLDSFEGSRCALSMDPQIEDGLLERMEVVCEWTTDDGSARVTDRLLFQLVPGTDRNTSLNPGAGWTREE